MKLNISFASDCRGGQQFSGARLKRALGSRVDVGRHLLSSDHIISKGNENSTVSKTRMTVTRRKNSRQLTLSLWTSSTLSYLLKH